MPSRESPPPRLGEEQGLEVSGTDEQTATAGAGEIPAPLDRAVVLPRRLARAQLHPVERPRGV
eukprot:CAMPEP_0194711856 /NCGR_PEP_ID=MMETSP0296-20130528/4108_1 /TAXON_ID=39354 /ORGANISM="Heterosigma akashiwo, Strain CCMP2393" /LENGTH=62 /DNA_ID=CAMNT_0039610071 /DNA_START=351 /DNA_END=535 /DNA_ORIENTATION=+